MSQGGFSASLFGYAKEHQEKVGALQKVLAIKLFSSIILDTAVRSGRARSNWQCSVGSARTGEVPNRGQDAAVKEVQDTAAQVDGTKDVTLVLINHLPYIYRLEYEGWSKQSPDGMVRKNVTRFSHLVAEQVKELKL